MKINFPFGKIVQLPNILFLASLLCKIFCIKIFFIYIFEIAVNFKQVYLAMNIPSYNKVKLASKSINKQCIFVQSKLTSNCT